MRTGTLEGLIRWLQMSEAERNKARRLFEKQIWEDKYGEKNNI